MDCICITSTLTAFLLNRRVMRIITNIEHSLRHKSCNINQGDTFWSRLSRKRLAASEERALKRQPGGEPSENGRPHRLLKKRLVHISSPSLYLH